MNENLSLYCVFEKRSDRDEIEIIFCVWEILTEKSKRNPREWMQRRLGKGKVRFRNKNHINFIF